MTQTKTSTSDISWDKDIEPKLGTIVSVEGGYTLAQRGVIELKDGSKVFVKVGTDELTKKWLQKEVEVYRKLNEAGYRYIPQLLAVNSDNTAMAIEYLEGASFENSWDTDKLEAVVNAQESLKEFAHLFNEDPLCRSDDVVSPESKWPRILHSNNIETINAKLKKLGVPTTFTREHIEELAKLNENWSLDSDTLVHEDIRADNFGYNPVTKQGKLIDWNWLCLGDASLDTTPLFINIYLSGFNPYEYHPEQYDKNMLAYLVSFWLESILSGDEDSSPRELAMRNAQAKNVTACVELLQSGV